MKKQVTKKKRNQKLKKKLASMTAIVLVLAVGVWGTMAYLSTLTDKKTNTFTGSGGILLKLTETNWDAYKNGTTVLTQDELNTLRGDTTGKVETQGEYLAKKYTPGMIIPKNPVLNNSNDTGGKSEYVAMRIDFLGASDSSNKTAITYAQLLNVIKLINFNHNDWTLAAVKTSTSGWTDKKSDNTNIITNNCLYSSNAYVALTGMDENIKNATSMIFLYTGIVSAQHNTSTLFDTIQIRNGYTSDVTNGSSTITAEPICAFTDASQTTPLDGSSGKEFPKFQIDVLGAAVEAGGSNGSDTIDSVDKAKTGLLNLLEK